MRNALAMQAAAHLGRLRKRNEDSVAVDSAHGLAILADGMGGYNAGDVASSMTVNLLLQGLTARFDAPSLTPPDWEGMVREEVAKTNAAVYWSAQSHAQLAGMGTTLVLALFRDDQLLCAHIGDSRLYRLRDERFEQLTRDHSLLQEEIDLGTRSAYELDHFRHKNLVTRALGVEPEVELEVRRYATQTDDIYLLCSDGLSDMASDEDIRDTIELKRKHLAQAAEALIKLANDHGGRDNIAVALVKVCRPASVRGGFFQAIGKRLFA